jgi:hypothetical protein
MVVTPETMLNRLLMMAKTRAETADPAALQKTFVPIKPLLAMLSRPEHQILYGRRGTGKTHLLVYLAQTIRQQGHLAIYLDMRTVGSSAGLYGDTTESVSLRATNLLIDVIQSLHQAILQAVIDDERYVDRLEDMSKGLDLLGESATAVRVVGSVEEETTVGHTQDRQRDVGAVVSFSQRPDVQVSGSRRTVISHKDERRRRQAGVEQAHLLLGPLAAAVKRISEACRPNQLWLLLDEWSNIPLELQPLLADLIRRTFLVTPNVVVKFGALERRSCFYNSGQQGDYVGIEPGADSSASLDLDEFLLFDDDQVRANDFFANLLYRHMSEAATGRLAWAEMEMDSAKAFVYRAFVTPGPFEELVHAAASVPRDVIQVAGLAALIADNQSISTRHVHAAARQYFLKDKLGKASVQASDLLSLVIDRCVNQSTRVLPVARSGEVNDPRIQELYDLRLIHRIRQAVALDKANYSRKFDIYVVDFGCFIDLIANGRVRAAKDGSPPRSARLIVDYNTALRRRSFVFLNLASADH